MNQVLLVNMPFAEIKFPSLSLSLLKSILNENKIVCDVIYLNIVFYSYIKQLDIYRYVAKQTLLGDWLFSEELFDSNRVTFNDRIPDDAEGVYRPSHHDNLKSILFKDELLSLRSKVKPFIEQCLNTIKWNDYSIIGFTSQFAQHVASLAMAKRIKEYWSDKIIAFGGSNCEGIMGEALLRVFPFVDWVFNGQADLSFPQAVIHWFVDKTLKDIPGVTYRHNDKIISQGYGPAIDLNKLPFPNFDDYFSAMKEWAPSDLHNSAIPLELSRGCWWSKKHQCAFCGLNREVRSFRSKSPERAEKEIKSITNHYGIYNIHLTDSLIDTVYFKTLLKDLADWGNLKSLFLECKPNLNRKQIHILRRASVKMFQAGIESLDTEILSLMQKGTTLLENIQFLKWARQYGIFVGWHILYGIPGEKRESYQRMASIIPLLVHLNPPLNLIPVRLQRFSPLFLYSKEWGIKGIKANEDYKLVYPFDQKDLDELAYFFDCDFDKKNHFADNTRLVVKELQPWWECWDEFELPLLVFERQRGKVIIYDTRPCRFNPVVELKEALAIAYRICETRQLFDHLTDRIRGIQKLKYYGDTNLRRELDELVERRLMLREGDWYLSLANNLKVMNEYNRTIITYLLSTN